MRSLHALFLTLLLAACGQTGDLYLPQKTPPPSAPDDAEKKKSNTPEAATPAPSPPQ
jgi:predicted small lipoprotein YifL